ncbi:hypothetical protein [Paracoccus sediminilitoris]|nr:hypothetical protein [Paracoccus sediminilitoris]
MKAPTGINEDALEYGVAKLNECTVSGIKSSCYYQRINDGHAMNDMPA